MTAIVSAEMVLYGGLIASRSSNDTTKEVLDRLDRLVDVGRRIKMYVSTVVMRIPSYDGDFEEPWYWEDYGRMLYEYSYHKGRFDALHDQDDERAFRHISANVPPHILRQFLWRRERNFNVTTQLFRYMRPSDGDDHHASPPFEYVYTTLDDSGVYGLNVEEANRLRNLSRTWNLGPAVKIYPGADEVAASLLAQLVVTESLSTTQRRPTARTLWRAPNATSLVPNYESQSVSETVHDQLRAAGLDVVEDEDTADVLFVVSNFARAPQLESSQQPSSSPFSDYAAVFDAVDTLPAHTPVVAFADVRYSNGGDRSFVSYLLERVRSSSRGRKLAPGAFAYAGWNTDANSVGTAAANAVLLALSNDQDDGVTNASKRFTLLRLEEDVLYQSDVRNALIAHVDAEGGDVNDLSPHIREYEQFAYDRLNNRTLARVLDLPFPVLSSVYFPWNRTFEIGFRTVSNGVF